MVKKPQDLSHLSTPQMLREEVGRRIRQFMRDKNWQQSELARRADLGRDSISQYCNGKAFPNSRSLEKLAKALSKTPQDIMPAEWQQLEIEKTASPMRVTEAPDGSFWLSINRSVSARLYSKIAQLFAEEAELVAKK